MTEAWANRTVEHRRLAESEARRADWKRWGPYVAERAWGTVREDYSKDGHAWRSFPHEHARSRAYRWNEDGLAGFCNRLQNLCLGLALWNGKDRILKERLFGLDGHQGNHGEDVKEFYVYEDGLPSHAYMRMLYRYPQVAYPYEELAAANAALGRDAPELELWDLLREDFEARRFTDVVAEYAKAAQEDILCRITVTNRGAEPADLHVLPQIWFRNTWSWGHNPARPELKVEGPQTLLAHERHLGPLHWSADGPEGSGRGFLFTDNDSNRRLLWGVHNETPYVKDAFHDVVVAGRPQASNPAARGTKAAAWFVLSLAPGASAEIRVRLTPHASSEPLAGFAEVFAERRAEADAFHEAVAPVGLSRGERDVHRRALAGLLWSKQFYHYSTELWRQGDPAGPAPPRGGQARAAQRGLGPRLLLRRPVDAGQVGVPVVRRLGPGLPLRAPGSRRSRVGQAPDHGDAA